MVITGITDKNILLVDFNHKLIITMNIPCYNFESILILYNASSDINSVVYGLYTFR